MGDKTSQEVAPATSTTTAASDAKGEPEPERITIDGMEYVVGSIAAEMAAQDLAIKQARILLLGHGYRVIVPNAQSARSTVVKADPDEVKAYFAGTGLSRAELADAVGVSASVIATVQNVNGDRWSQERFLRAKVLIADAVALKAAAKA